MVKISSRAEKLPFSPIRKLAPFAMAAKKRGIKIYHLNIGQPDIISPEIFLQKLKNFPERVVAYEQSDGNLKLKETLSDYYRKIGLYVQPSEIIITQGGSEALTIAFFILLNTGEECLTLEPMYTNYLSFAKTAGIKIKTLPTYLKDNFALPPVSAFQKAVGPKTKAILICNPSNPTGALYPKKILEQLVDFCLKRNIFIIADETYREFVYDRQKVTSLMSFKKAGKLTVLTDSLSKRYSLCGARLGCLASKNPQVVEAALKIAQARLSASTPEQYAASFLNKVPKIYWAKIRQEYQSRRDVLCEELAKIPNVKFAKPEGAFYLIAQLPVKNAEDFCRFLLEKFNYKNETVMLAPAEGFYQTPGLGKNQVRIAYVLKNEDLKKACILLKEALKKYRK